MAIAKKGSRIIVIDGVRYRWRVSPDDGFMDLVAEHASAPGQRLSVQIDYEDERRPIGKGAFATKQGRSIDPGTVHVVILSAIAQGWDPESRGPPLRFRFQGDQLIPWEVWRGR